MDSKLPKPSGLKRPTPVTRTILPTDRIKSSANMSMSAISNKLKSSSSTTSLFNYPPLSRDLLNIPNGGIRRDRALSPEMHRPTAPNRAKLRRSRSACDVRAMDHGTMKRPNFGMPTIPAKNPRLASNPALNNISTMPSTAASRQLTRPIKRPATATTTTSNTARPPIGRNGAAGGGASSLTAKTKTDTGNKPATVKRIAPYDFKARFHDLLEKHKALKAKYEIKEEQMAHLDGLPEQFEESQAQLYSTQEQLRNAQTDIECKQRQIQADDAKIKTITNDYLKVRDDFDQIKIKYEAILKERQQLSIEVKDLRECKTTLTERNDELTNEMEVFKEQLFRSNIERKELHNTIMDLRGNIRVFCRVRPPLDFEQDKMLCEWNYLDEATVEIANPDLLNRHKTGQHTFNFDQVFHPNSRQEDIFELVSPLIQSALDGYNVCIFAYGQTGSGKTFTMDGLSTNLGVIPRTVDLLFDSIENYKRLGWEYEIKVTFLEIYNEVLYDLLSNEQKDMEIRMASHNKNDIYVTNITEETVSSAGHLQQLMHIAKMNRATASTIGNERSSRSHAVTKIQLIGWQREKNETSIGSINLVDLAGSESPKTSVRMNETKNINRSLSELTNVILALLQKQDHIPYRNSKLTHLLMPSLGGNSKTLMFINVAPFLDCFGESVKSLRFAASVNSCKMAKAKRNRFLNNSTANSSSGSFENKNI